MGVDDRNEIWKEHMETLMNVENEWNDSTDASKVEDAVRRIAVNRCGVQWMVCKSWKHVRALGLQ